MGRFVKQHKTAVLFSSVVSMCLDFLYPSPILAYVVDEPQMHLFGIKFYFPDCTPSGTSAM